MKNTILFSTIALFICAFSSCTSSKSATPQNELSALQTIMTGSFDSSKQAAKDSTYYNISLHMYPIWKSKDGYWLYVEQALNSNQSKPYRQRIYQLEKLENGDFSSKVFTLENPEDFIGKWKSLDYFDQFDASLLKEREGCAVFLKKEGNSYVGSTNEKNCKSTMRGASYATSIVYIKPNVIESWDRGFDAENKHVWGAEKAGYIFKRLK
ncbi:Phycocyanobilin lyase CpcT [Kordia antarctica]|uniref:Phycocyanobilin lyase CpcT n=1 Tax=Kordia antarctica TaxID=1218801 RepID=A0A7L4ZHW0_9FLAO|nr:chromophore lyase CpcT/CpeT [Kordia antarctica]QHI36222.1 Phycocyanobilin lyase CpcT [Kordia antarctica]